MLIDFKPEGEEQTSPDPVGAYYARGSRSIASVASAFTLLASFKESVKAIEEAKSQLEFIIAKIPRGRRQAEAMIEHEGDIAAKLVVAAGRGIHAKIGLEDPDFEADIRIANEKG